MTHILVMSVILLLSLTASSQNENAISIKHSRKASASISNFDMNVVYEGFRNRIFISTKRVNKNYKVTCDGCQSFKADTIPGVYIVEVEGDRKIAINILGRKKTETKEFRVIPRAIPTIFIIGTDPMNRHVAQEVLKNARFTSRLTNSPLSVSTQISVEKVTVIYNGKTTNFEGSGNALSQNAKNYVAKMKSGETMVIYFKCQMNGKEVEVKPIPYTIL